MTIARALSDTFAGIRPVDVPPFVLAQLVGAVSALAVCRWLLAERAKAAEDACGGGIGHHFGYTLPCAPLQSSSTKEGPCD